MPLPPFTEDGDLPFGAHRATIRGALQRFAVGTPQRKAVGARLARIYELATATGAVDRVFVFGSFVSDEPEPNDVDVFLLMKDSFDLNSVTGQARLIFEHAAAQSHFGASVFWLRRPSLYPTEEEAIAGWQIKRDGTRRGIVELVSEAP